MNAHRLVSEPVKGGSYRGNPRSSLPMHLDIPSRQGSPCHIAIVGLNAERVASGAGLSHIGYIDPVGGRHAVDRRVPEESSCSPTARIRGLHEGGHIHTFDHGLRLPRRIDDRTVTREAVDRTPGVEAKSNLVDRVRSEDMTAASDQTRR